MRTTKMVVGTIIALAVVAGCSSDDGFEVELLAGGGDQPDGSGADAALPLAVTRLSSDGDGTLWGVAGTDVMVQVSEDGDVRSSQLQLAAGAVQEIAAGPDGRVYVLPDLAGQEAAVAVVYAYSDGDLLPAVGLPMPAPDAPGPTTPDGEPAAEAELGHVADIAVDSEGRLLFTEQVDPAGVDAGFLLRRVESDGTLTTVAGRPNPDYDRSLTDDESGAAFFPDGVEATDLTLFSESAIVAGPGDQVVVQTTQSVYTIADGTAATVLGTPGGGDMPPASDDGPFTESVDALTVGYQPGFPLLSLAVNEEGGILASAGALTGWDEDAYSWRVEDGSEQAQAVADAAAGDAQTAHPTLYVAPDGQASIAAVFGSPATWADDDTIAVAASGDDDQIIVLIDLPE